MAHLSGPASHEQQIRAAETRLLYENAPTGLVVTTVIAALLAYAEWHVVPRTILLAWLGYVLVVAAARLVLLLRFRRAAPPDHETGRWDAAFVAGGALAGAGWGAASLLLYPVGTPINEVLVVFAVGGVMLGGASLLAARPAAFVTFLVLAGLLTAVRLLLERDEHHVMMGLLAAVFTLATVLTTWRFHRAIESSFKLRFANVGLIESLRLAKQHTETLNRELELRVRDRTAQLIEADRRKDEFLATLAHELRNPLAPIRFAVQSLKEGAPAAAAAHARDVIDRQVTQMVRLVDDLLDVSRITANKIQLHREALDLSNLMTTAAESTTPLASAQGQILDVELPATPVLVYGDATRLVQVFTNVLNNAVKFTPRGGRIRFAASQHSNEVVVRIIDSGVGIPNDVLPLVFDMFHQSEHVSTGGLGIGLTLTRRLVEMHNGRIAIASAGPGQGTEVEIALPVTSLPAVVEKPAVAGAGAQSSLRVLIVEDNVDAADMLELAVSTLGHITALAHDGSAAVTVARTFLPDVIFLDIGLPGMSGYEVARTLRALPEFRAVHIAAITGWGQAEDRQRAREAGFDSHFTKPLAPETVQQLLATLAARRERGAEVSES